MNLASSDSAKEIRQEQPNPNFVVGSPRFNPLVPRAPLSITKHDEGLGLELTAGAEASADQYGFLHRIVENSRREVEKNPRKRTRSLQLGCRITELWRRLFGANRARQSFTWMRPTLLQPPPLRASKSKPKTWKGPQRFIRRFRRTIREIQLLI